VLSYIQKLILMKYRVFTLLLLVFHFGLYNCKQKNESGSTGANAIPVTVLQVQKKPVHREISISGNIEGNHTVKLGFMVAGKINFILAGEGQKVTKGQLVASLDPENYAIARELADIQVAQVEDEYNRLKAMHDTRSISDGDFARIGFGLQQAKVQQKLHAKNLAETKLYSPINGVLLKKLAETGEITATGIPVAVISDISLVKAAAFVPENELHLVKIGQPAQVKISSLDTLFTGKVSDVGAVADPTARAFTVKIEISNPHGKICPGMIAEINLVTGEIQEIIELPLETVLIDFNNTNYVFITDSISGKAFKRSISIGKLHDNQVEIVSGLAEDEFVVTGGQHKLTDGTQVIIQK
jgi:membrane fusion protein, multidrug efflux system